MRATVDCARKADHPSPIRWRILRISCPETSHRSVTPVTDHGILAAYCVTELHSPEHFAGGHSATTRADAGNNFAEFRVRLQLRANQEPTTTVNPFGERGQHLWKLLCCLPRTRWSRQGSGLQSAETKVPDLTRLSLRHNGAFPALHVRTVITFGADDLLPAHGSKEMPMWGPTFHEIEFDQDLGNVRLENVTRYLESIQRK